jgi:hypothetical protein
MSATSLTKRQSTFVRVVWPSIALMLFFAATGSMFVWWHYYICTDPGAVGVRHFYTHRFELPSRGRPGWIDLLLPASFMGFATGLAGARLRLGWTAAHVLVIAVVIAMLQPALARWVPPAELWWMPAHGKWPPLSRMIYFVFFSALYCAVFAYLGRLYGQRWWGMGDNPQPCG